MTKWNEILENAIIGKLITALIDEGYRVELSDQDGGGLHCYAWQTERRPTAGNFNHWVKLVLGNGADVLSDYSTNLENTLKEVNAFAASFQD